MVSDGNLPPLKRILVDFDGVIHKYSEGWKDGSIYDEPIEGAIEAIEQLRADGWEIVIFTAVSPHGEKRNELIREWLAKYGLADLIVTNTKLPLTVLIDDNAIRFTNWQEMLSHSALAELLDYEEIRNSSAITEIIREVASEHFGEPENVELLGTVTCKVTYPEEKQQPHRYMKVRFLGTSEVDLWIHRQLDNVPQILKVVEHEHYDRSLKFVEWWSGEQFPVQGVDIAKLPVERFRQYGEFLKRMSWRELYIKDDSWKNVMWSPERNAVWNCDIHSIGRKPDNYTEIIERRTTPEQFEAFSQGLITTKDDLMELASHYGSGFLQGRHYQSTDVADIHIPGKRSAYRFELMDMSSLAGKSVVDFGCGRGMCCFEAAKNGADFVLGIENIGEVPYMLTTWSNALSAYAGLSDHLHFQPFNLDSEWNIFESYMRDMMPGHKWDVVFCFAVIRHLKESARLMKYIDESTDLMYFEGQLSETREQVEAKIKQTTTFTDIEYLGNASEHDNEPKEIIRHLFRCSR